jgi:hypothetical protein
VAEENTAEIIFDAEHKLHTRNTPGEIKNRMEGVTTPHIPLIEVELPNGDTEMVNAAQIRVIRSAPLPTAEDYRIEQV